MNNRIKELRLKAGLTQEQLAKEVEITRQAISHYEKTSRQPKVEIAQKLANYFNVSVPYLQGYAEINIPNDLKFESKQDAIDCIERIMKAQGISKEDLRTEHENEINKKQKICPYCKGHKKFAVMDGYFICQIIGNKLKFELGDIADSYEVEPFELPLGFCFACGSKLKRE